MLTSRLTFASLTLAVILAGCSDSSDTPSTFIACDLGQLHVEGDIDGMPVNITQSSENSGFGQSETGGGFWMNDPFPDGTRMNLSIDWSPSIVDGATSNVTTATLIMPSQPTTVALAGQTLCAGSGSQIRIPKKSEKVADLQFNLTSLTGGTGCGEAHTGMVRGCWRLSAH